MFAIAELYNIIDMLFLIVFLLLMTLQIYLLSFSMIHLKLNITFTQLPKLSPVCICYFLVVPIATPPKHTAFTNRTTSILYRISTRDRCTRDTAAADRASETLAGPTGILGVSHCLTVQQHHGPVPAVYRVKGEEDT